MKKYSIKRNNRPKALFGADGAIMAAATLAAAGLQANATANAAKTQANSITQQAKTQAQALKLQNDNNTMLQQQNIDFIRSQNKEARDQQQQIQTTLQMLAAEQNMNNRLDKNKVTFKYGGIKRKLRNTYPFYGGLPFQVTDGGGAIPLDVDNNGYGLYELYGDDHKHYHKTKGGKYKSGVGIKLNDGTVVEGEGNQNTNKGEKIYVTPTDTLFISKHNIKGFNPADAVDNGMNPKEAFYMQEFLKNNRINNRKKAINGYSIAINNPNNYYDNYYPPYNYVTNDITAGIVSNKTPVKNRYSLKCGGRHKAANGFWKNHAGAVYSGIGNLGAMGIGLIGNALAGKYLNNAYNEAGNILADAYSNLKGIDISQINREDYSAAPVMAVVRTPNTNFNPKLERIRRNAIAEQKFINKNTLSSAAKQQKLAGVNDRMYDRLGEIYAEKYNEDEAIARENTKAITQASIANAELQSKANEKYGQSVLDLLKYNNEIENSKLLGAAEAKADAITNRANAMSNIYTNSASLIGSALTSTGSAFAKSYDAIRKTNADIKNVMFGLDLDKQANAAIITNNSDIAKGVYEIAKTRYSTTGDNYYSNIISMLEDKFKFN